MKTKITLLVSTAVCTLLASSPAMAAGNFYVGIGGGANYLQDDSFLVVTTPTVSADTLDFNPNSDAGYVVSASVGMHLDQVMNGLRVELEGAYRDNDVNGTWQSNTGNPAGVSSGTLDYMHTSWSVMSNAWYDFNVGTGFKPYVGGGIGWAETRLKGRYVGSSVDPDSFKFNDSGFAWQLGAGVKFAISPTIDVGIGYRYFSGPSVDVSSIYPTNVSVGTLNSDNQSVQVGLTFNM